MPWGPAGCLQRKKGVLIGSAGPEVATGWAWWDKPGSSWNSSWPCMGNTRVHSKSLLDRFACGPISEFMTWRRLVFKELKLG